MLEILNNEQSSKKFLLQRQHKIILNEEENFQNLIRQWIVNKMRLMNKMNNILITIAARQGSNGIPSKNLIKINGEFPIERAINLAKNTELSNFIVVSTDSDDIKKIALRRELIAGSRPHDLSKDNVPKVEVINQALIKAERHFNKKFDTVIDLDVTAP